MDKKKKILIATGIYPPDIGGPATYVKTLEAELPKFGFEIRVITYTDDDSEKDNVIRIKRQQHLALRYFKYFLAVYRMLPWADIVYLQGPVSEGLPAAIACMLRGKPYLLKVVGDYAWEQASQRFGVTDLLDNFQNHRYSWPVELMRYIEKKVTRRAELVITPSAYLKSIVEGWGVKNKIEVIYNSVEDLSNNLTRTDYKKILNIQGDIIVSVGRLVPWKGFDRLIELMPKLVGINDFKLVIIGDGPDFNKLKAQSDSISCHPRVGGDPEINSETKVEQAVVFTGSLPHSEVLKYLGAADIFILNSSYEGLSHVLIEAMQMGAPVIATDAGGNPELVENGVTGLLVKYGEPDQLAAAIQKLWQDKEFANRLAANAMIKIKEKFNKSKMINHLVGVLSDRP